jgi:type I restriction enzyme, S subunit
VRKREQRLKYLYRIVDKRAGMDRPSLMAVSIHRGVVPRESLTDDQPRAEDLSNYKICEPGDIVLNRMRAFQGAVGVSPGRGIVSPDYMVMRPVGGVDSRYLHNLFRSTWFVGEMTSRLRGIGGTDVGNVRTPRINPEDLGEIRVALPSLEEQRLIADFLDAEVARIDYLVSMQIRVSGCLMEREQVLLDAGLDELIGRYGSLLFRRFIYRTEQGSSPQCDNIPAEDDEWGVLKVSAVKAGRFVPTENKRLPDEIAPDRRWEIKRDDLLITRANTPALVGAVAVAKDPRPKLLLCDKIFRINVISELDKDFLALAARGSRIRAMCSEASHGTSQSMANLKIDEIKQWPIPFAPLREQRAFVACVREASATSERLQTAIARQLKLLEERRRAVITAAVTGQIDVTTAGRVSV